jgi:hypothetical protein
VQVLSLVIALMVAREVVQRIYMALGTGETAPAESA